MSLLDDVAGFISRWRPGLPSLGASPPSVWLVDPDPEVKGPSEHALAFLVTPDREEARLLANRTGEPVEIDEGALVKKVEKMYIEPGDQPVLVWSCRLLTAAEVEDTTPHLKRHVHRLPEDVTDVALPQRELSQQELVELGERF